MENFYTTVQTPTGNVINGATVTVYDAGSGLPATIYEPDGVTPLANPFLSGYARSEGEIEFGAANGQYNIQIVNGTETDWIYRITLIDAAGASLGALAYENDASGVPITDAGAYYASTDVEGALQEAGADLATHIADPAGAHAASAISVVDAGAFYASTDVEGALQEAAQFAPNYAYFTETRSTASPNGAIPVHQWVVSGAETNIDAALTPKGTGAILSQVPDGTAAGGNKRGSYAVDWQFQRGAATQVASGLNSHIPGGYGNTASATYSSALGGALNDASGHGSTTLGGVYGTTRGLAGRISYADGRFSVTGDAQFGIHVLGRLTTDATPVIMHAGEPFNSVHGAATVPALPDNHAYIITASIVARDISTGDAASWIIKGVAKRGAGAATTALVGTPSIETIAMDAGASAWGVELIADTSLGAAEIRVTGEATTTIHWVCKFDTVEVG